MNFVSNNSIYNVFAPKIAFKTTQNPNVQNQNLRKDSFNSNPIYADFHDKNYITRLVQANPKIKEILAKNRIPLNVNIKELEELKQGHLLQTRIVAAKIYSALPQELKQNINLVDLQQAAMLHDYGKVLIPPKILNKNGALTPEEKKIMELHSELGAELLAQQGVKEEVVKLVKYHHQNSKGTGYPQFQKDDNFSIVAQIISVADKYSALVEARCYKEPLSREETLSKIKEDVDSGNLEKEIFEALKKVV